MFSVLGSSAMFNIGTANFVYNQFCHSNVQRKEVVRVYLILHIKFEFGMRFAALILFFVVESQNFMSGTVFSEVPYMIRRSI